MNSIQLIECPRDAMQGWQHFIPTAQKIDYLNCLLQVGFDTLDFGSFVSPKAIPQMADTAQVLQHLQLQNTNTKLLAIVANTRGAIDATAFEQISYLGFPFSLSPTFQFRNTNSSQIESLQRIDEIQNLCIQHNKKLVVYLSMGFGNPYNDTYNEEILLHWANEMALRNIEIVSLADTVGIGTPAQIQFALQTLIPQYSHITFGVHLHSSTHNFAQKLQSAIDAGCTRFDGALKGIGGCPMAQDELIGNIDTEKMIKYFEEKKLFTQYNQQALAKALVMANSIFV